MIIKPETREPLNVDKSGDAKRFTGRLAPFRWVIPSVHTGRLAPFRWVVNSMPSGSQLNAQRQGASPPVLACEVSGTAPNSVS